MMTMDISMNRTNGMILLDEDEEEAWEAQLRIGMSVRSGPKAPEKTGERISNENDAFDDMGSGPNTRNIRWPGKANAEPHAP